MSSARWDPWNWDGSVQARLNNRQPTKKVKREFRSLRSLMAIMRLARLTATSAIGVWSTLLIGIVHMLSCSSVSHIVCHCHPEVRVQPTLIINIAYILLYLTPIYNVYHLLLSILLIRRCFTVQVYCTEHRTHYVALLQALLQALYYRHPDIRHTCSRSAGPRLKAQGPRRSQLLKGSNMLGT